jgi:hypothetical protein
MKEDKGMKRVVNTDGFVEYEIAEADIDRLGDISAFEDFDPEVDFPLYVDRHGVENKDRIRLYYGAEFFQALEALPKSFHDYKIAKKLNKNLGYETLVIIADTGDEYQYRNSTHLFKNGDPNFSSDQWSEEEKLIAGMLSAEHHLSRKDSLENDREYIEYTLAKFDRAGCNFSETPTGRRLASELDDINDMLYHIEILEKLLKNKEVGVRDGS